MVMLFTLLPVGDGSSVPGLSLVVSVAVLACFAVLPSAIVSSCDLFSGAGSACLLWYDVGEVASGRSVIACLVVVGMLKLCGACCVGASNASSISMVCVLLSSACAGVVPVVLGSGIKVGAATVRFVGFHG